jgi:hypothetical protein
MAILDEAARDGRTKTGRSTSHENNHLLLLCIETTL